MTAVLVLGGTGEAVTLARRLASEPDFDVVYSLAGRTRAPSLPGCRVRKGGFGGAEGLARYAAGNEIAAIVDATHPYAARMAANARAAASASGALWFKYLRPPWNEPADAPWLHAATPDEAARIVDGRFRRVFLSSGLGAAGAFSHLAGTWFLVRSVDAPKAPLPLARYRHVAGRGPFDREGEIALLREHRIDALVSKNSGGEATVAKLHAAQELGVPVVMIDRPPMPEGVVYADPARLAAAVRRALN